MHGFKSFAVRTVLEFSTGITAVVGPNGAGKSNVADAVRWVLGEQSMRQLRGKKSDDIIFSGGHGKSALGMAEVSLTIDNSTGWVPSEYSEIMVTRRSYRSGENEYLINKQKARLKDVILLLAQARIGHDSYTVVGQGLVDAALSLRAEERRGLFEDAAGIRPFQVQRVEAEGRLRQTEQNLERLRDIVGEIEPRLGYLEEQARRAREYGKLNSELQEVLLTWYALQWRRLRVARDSAEAAEQEQAERVRKMEQALQAADEERDILRGMRQGVQTRIVDARTAFTGAGDFAQKTERDLAVNEERITGLERQRSQQQEEELRMRERLVLIQQQAIDLEEQCSLVDEALDTDAAALARLETQAAAAQKDYEFDERRLRTVQSELIQVQARLGANQTDLGRQQKHLGERNRALASRREIIAQAQQSLRMLERRLVEERALLGTARSEEQRVIQRKQALARANADSQQEIERLQSALAEAERQRRTFSDRLNMLKNWRQNLSGYGDGVPGLAWRHVQCEQRYLALFHRLLRWVVLVKDLETAGALLALIAEDAHLEALVTLRGEVLHAGGWLTGGSGKDSAQQGLLAYERELHELPQQLDDAKILIDRLNSRISELQRSQEARHIEQAAVDKELQKITGRINGLSKAVDTTLREQERVQTESQLTVSIEQQLAAEVAGLEQEVQAAGERVQAHEKSQREIAGLVEELQEEVEERAATFRSQQDELGRTRTALAVKRQEAKSLRQQLATHRAQAQDLKEQVEQRVARIKDAEQQRKVLLEAVSLQRVELEQSQARARKLAEELRRVEGEASEIDQQTMALEQQTLEMRHTMTELESIYRRCLLESQKIRDAVDALLEQLREEMGVEDPRDLVRNIEGLETNQQAAVADDAGMLSEEEEARLRRLRRQVESLRSRLKALGGCDPDAPMQYDETRTRYEFLSSQIADMEQAALHLHSIIEQLDAMMAKQFEVTFQAVNARFREHFTTLFHGGSARLELTSPRTSEEDAPSASPTSSVPAGVEVIVQPPGKKVQDLSLLSGGERALVSAALLFALLEINPPPFCLLDEVDAALDESNVTRFCDILRQLGQRTQFIVITHNRVTMTSAQVIYGVSMGADSVSRLISLKLEEATVAGDR